MHAPGYVLCVFCWIFQRLILIHCTYKPRYPTIHRPLSHPYAKVVREPKHWKYCWEKITYRTKIFGRHQKPNGPTLPSKPLVLEPANIGSYLPRKAADDALSSLLTRFQTDWYTGRDREQFDLTCWGGCTSSALMGASIYVLFVMWKRSILHWRFFRHFGPLTRPKFLPLSLWRPASGLLSWDPRSGRSAGIRLVLPTEPFSSVFNLLMQEQGKLRAGDPHLTMLEYDWLAG